MGRGEHPGEHPAILEAKQDRSFRFRHIHNRAQVVHPMLERQRLHLGGPVREP
ncbi:MAG: hypothetical protein M3P43_04605 [Actinomycetota bacterium]|nr:hypothetical protein [Actinomycetota bacterium]